MLDLCLYNIREYNNAKSSDKNLGMKERKQRQLKREKYQTFALDIIKKLEDNKEFKEALDICKKSPDDALIKNLEIIIHFLLEIKEETLFRKFLKKLIIANNDITISNIATQLELISEKAKDNDFSKKLLSARIDEYIGLYQPRIDLVNQLRQCKNEDDIHSLENKVYKLFCFPTHKHSEVDKSTYIRCLIGLNPLKTEYWEALIKQDDKAYYYGILFNNKYKKNTFSKLLENGMYFINEKTDRNSIVKLIKINEKTLFDFFKTQEENHSQYQKELNDCLELFNTTGRHYKFDWRSLPDKTFMEAKSAVDELKKSEYRMDWITAEKLKLIIEDMKKIDKLNKNFSKKLTDKKTEIIQCIENHFANNDANNKNTLTMEIEYILFRKAPQNINDLTRENYFSMDDRSNLHSKLSIKFLMQQLKLLWKLREAQYDLLKVSNIFIAFVKYCLSNYKQTPHAELAVIALFSSPTIVLRHLTELGEIIKQNQLSSPLKEFILMKLDEIAKSTIRLSREQIQIYQMMIDLTLHPADDDLEIELNRLQRLHYNSYFSPHPKYQLHTPSAPSLSSLEVQPPQSQLPQPSAPPQSVSPGRHHAALFTNSYTTLNSDQEMSKKTLSSEQGAPIYDFLSILKVNTNIGH